MERSRFKRISIPYSTIKRDERLAAENAAIVFQFLIVRLKVSGSLARYGACFISIPYSTIKSLKFVLKIFLIFKTLFFTKIRKINRKNVDFRS